MSWLTYAAVTPVRDEKENLPRLAACLAAQTQQPLEWVIVDTGSTDGTLEVARELAETHAWIAVVALGPVARTATRGAPIVRAFEHGAARLRSCPHVIVKLDADTSMPAEYFAGLLDAFAADESLGIASGALSEQEPAGEWVRRHVAPGCAWGASRAYRRECLEAVSPLEHAFGWDGIDQLQAELAGWRTDVVDVVEFRHHRREGERDGNRGAGWRAQGRGSYFMGYRFSFLVLRALYQARRDVAALAMIAGYLEGWSRRSETCTRAEVKEHLREQQALRNLIRRRFASTV